MEHCAQPTGGKYLARGSKAPGHSRGIYKSSVIHAPDLTSISSPSQPKNLISNWRGYSGAKPTSSDRNRQANESRDQSGCWNQRHWSCRITEAVTSESQLLPMGELRGDEECPSMFIAPGRVVASPSNNGRVISGSEVRFGGHPPATRENTRLFQ